MHAGSWLMACWPLTHKNPLCWMSCIIWKKNKSANSTQQNREKNLITKCSCWRQKNYKRVIWQQFQGEPGFSETRTLHQKNARLLVNSRLNFEPNALIIGVSIHDYCLEPEQIRKITSVIVFDLIRRGKRCIKWRTRGKLLARWCMKKNVRSMPLNCK